MSLLFNWVDLVIGVVACRFLYKGYKNGLPKELFACARMAVVLLLSLSYFLWASRLLQEKTLLSATYAKLISFTGLGILTYIGVSLAGKILGAMATVQFSSWFDKTATFFVSLFHYGVTLGYVLFLTMLVPTTFSHKQVYEKSFVGKRVVRLILKNYTRVVKREPLGPARPADLEDFHKTTLSSSVGE